MAVSPPKPRVVLLCHDDDPIDTEGLTAWLATSFALVGRVVIHSPWTRRAQAARREVRRSGWTGFLDVAAFRMYYALALTRRDANWCAGEVTRLTTRYLERADQTPQIDVENPNDESVRQFLEHLAPDLVLARCKMLLKPAIFRVARSGTFALHPGICPEYRNSHGCFWALARRDLLRVGMTLLRIDAGVDTGPIFFRGTCAFDERHESHIVIQYRVVTENLDAIAETLHRVCDGSAQPLADRGRASGVWGQPRLSAYWTWKRAARRSRPNANRLAALS